MTTATRTLTVAAAALFATLGSFAATTAHAQDLPEAPQLHVATTGYDLTTTKGVSALHHKLRRAIAAVCDGVVDNYPRPLVDAEACRLRETIKADAEVKAMQAAAVQMAATRPLELANRGR